ncbi:hypothetical protein [Faecalibacterium sp. I4-1-79]|uniref:hypothetical protein n=1 Tax=Faecalibacterium sp. I4-1-79 TaxID=2929494 RepID=UPI002014B2CB|nr:hypothetical protein [Faecalibacterium sp. I4-1-79]UQK41638.1 hypothetical protein MTP36_07540 [Faecalibacterium sp. I4-1-79]
MLVRIVKRTFSGAEYCPEQKVLKLGGEGSTGVETLEFELPEEWAGMAVTVHVQQLDGTLPQSVLLGEDRCLEVDRMFTASEKGLWMLRAMDGNGYCAMTRPARYECYETFATDGDTEITPSQYEAFVAQVLGAANTASQKAKDAQSAADRAEGAAGEAQKAKAAAADSAQQAKGEAESAQTAAQQADKAAARAEGYAPKDGTVLSVNGKGGAVSLNAADVGAMDADRGDLVQQVVLEGRTLTVVFTDGTQQTYTTQDTTELTAMTGVLSTENGGTGLDRALTAADVGAVEKGSGDYLKGNRGNYRLRIEQRGEWKGLTVCAHWHTPGASAVTLVENGVLTVPAAVTAVPGVGCITFEGTDGSCTVTSADVRCKVCANSGTAEGAMPAPATPAWEALVGMLGTGGITTAEKRAVLTVLRTLAAGNDAAAAACDRLEALWGADDPDNRNTARLSLAVLGRMILGRS